MITWFPTREILVSDIPAGDSKIANLFLQWKKSELLHTDRDPDWWYIITFVYWQEKAISTISKMFFMIFVLFFTKRKNFTMNNSSWCLKYTMLRIYGKNLSFWATVSQNKSEFRCWKYWILLPYFFWRVFLAYFRLEDKMAYAKIF